MKKINTFQTTNNKKIVKDAFLLISPIAMAITAELPVLYSFSIALSPFLFNSLSIKSRFKSGYFGAELDFKQDKNYYKVFNKNLFKYVEKSESELEKKLKIIFSFLWMINKRITISKCTSGLSIKKDLNIYKSYLNKLGIGEDSINMVYDDSSDHYSLTSSLISSNELTSLLNTNKDLEIAKKVYKDFEDEGFLGNYFHYFNYPIMDLLLKIQDYTLNNKDIEVITDKSKIKNISVFIGYKRLENLSNNFKENKNSIRILDKIITNKNNENNIDNIMSFFQESNKYEGYNEAISYIQTYKEKEMLEKSLPVKEVRKIVKKI